MANKRDFKKAVSRACGSIVDECIFAEQMFGGDPEKWENIVVRTAMMQHNAMKGLAAQFGKKVKEFGSKREYRKARHAFARQTVADVEAFLRKEVESIAVDMNALMPKQQ